MRASAQRAKHELAARILPALPTRLRNRLVQPQYNWSLKELRPVATANSGDIRLLVGRANYGGQGYQWARAAETLPGVSAVNLRFLPDDTFIGGPADFNVRKNVGQWSHLWARRQRRAIKKDFTHVLIEAELPLLGGLYDGDLKAEIRDLQDAGIKVALVSHGTDTRLPSLHRKLEKDSPFASPLDGFTEAAEARASANIQLMDELGLPEFVSTPDLLQFRPGAKWLPGISSPERWIDCPPTRLESEVPVVLHVPGRNGALKGAPAISAAMHRLQNEGLIEYREIHRASRDEMTAEILNADIVVNQVSMGLYATVAVEAMLAGRIVVSQVWDSVRDHIKTQTGKKVPIVEANSDTVYDVVKNIVLNPDSFRDLGAKSREFALTAHSREHAAKVLEDFLRS